MMDDPTVLAALFGFAAIAISIPLGLLWLAMRSWRRRSDLFRQHAACIADLKRNGAEALVLEFPIHGADLLGWIAKHRLLPQAEADALIDGARQRFDKQYGEAFPNAASAPSSRSRADATIDDEIPF